jgi:hypothetical protein
MSSTTRIWRWCTGKLFQIKNIFFCSRWYSHGRRFKHKNLVTYFPWYQPAFENVTELIFAAIMVLLQYNTPDLNRKQSWQYSELSALNFFFHLLKVMRKIGASQVADVRYWSLFGSCRIYSSFEYGTNKRNWLYSFLNYGTKKEKLMYSFFN